MLCTDKYIAEIWIIEIFFSKLIENILLDFFLFLLSKRKRGSGDTYTMTSKSQVQKTTTSRVQDQNAVTSGFGD